MNRKTVIAALAGAAVLAAGAALYFALGTRMAATSGPAVWLPAEAPTRPGWTARVTPLAGDGTDGVVDGAALASRFSDPFGAAVDAHGNVFVADGGSSNRIRRIGPDGQVATFAGGRAGFADGPAGATAFDTPSALAIDRLGNLYVADTYNDRIRRIGRDGTVTTVAGSGAPGNMDGMGTAAGFDTPSAIVVDKNGMLYVADTGNDAIRRIGKDGAVTTLAPPIENERRALPRLPLALALTHDGYLYIGGEAGGRIVQLDPGGRYHALVDADRPSGASYASDGSVRLYAPRGIAVRPDGSLVVADGQALQVYALARPRSGAPARQTVPAPAPPMATSAVMPWPVSPQFEPHEVVGVMGEVRGSYAGESRDHFHAGLDIRADVGTRVLNRPGFRGGRSV